MGIHRHIITVAMVLLLSSCGQQKDDAAYVLSFASPYPPSHPFSVADREWMAVVSERAGGQIRFKPFWSGSLISSDMSMLEIARGVADIGLITPIYTRGGAHALRAQAGFYSGVGTIEEQVAIYDCLAQQFPAFARELEGLRVLAVQGGNFPGILTRDRPVQKLEDLRGLRLRAPTETVSVLRRLGADPVNMPMGEVYSALAKGVIDGVVAPADTFHSLHFSEVAEHFTTLRFPRGAYPARAMSARTWEQLPPDLQQLIAASRTVWEAALSRELRQAEAAGTEYGKTHGIQFHAISSAEQAQFDAIYEAVALEEARELATLGIEGEAMFRTVQALIATPGPRDCKGDDA